MSQKEKLKTKILVWRQWLTPIILATQDQGLTAAGAKSF
jgi:hypothetical protein